MTRPFLAFVALTVVPCGLASWPAARSADQAQSELAYETTASIARLTLGTLDQDLGAAVDSLLASAELLPNPDTTVAAIRLALAGDTVSALDPTASGVEVMVLFPDTSPGALRFAQGMLQPGAAMLVGRIARARVGLYLNGQPWSVSDPPPSAASIDRATLVAASGAPGGVRSDAGTVVAMDPRAGLQAAIVALVEPEAAVEHAVPLGVRLVIGLLLLFSAVAAWILLTRTRGSAGNGSEPREPERARATSRAALVLLACVPLLTFLGLLVHIERTFADAARDATTRDVSRAVAVIGTLGLAGSPTAVHALSGLHAARIQGGVVTSSTLSDGYAGLEAVPAPPPSFTTSGVVETETGTSHYVARRLDRQSFSVVLAPVPLAQIGALRERLMMIGGGLMAWMIFVAVGVTLRSSRAR
ncbi:MAG: hypothetical protein VX815_07150 [Gemmatimonadota bacterium]|nr:hypothetical protein [Gemmatimonadota bacterium]